jgi:hypothetical protein
MNLIINLDTGVVIGPIDMLSMLTSSPICGIDSDEIEQNNEGNCDGTFIVEFQSPTNSDAFQSITITGEHFSPQLLMFSTLNDEERQQFLTDLVEKIQQELN